MTKIVTDIMRVEMQKLYDSGMSQASIAKEFGIDESTVSYWLKNEQARERLRGEARQNIIRYYEKRQLQTERCCPHCKRVLPMSEFRKTQSYCKECHREYGRAYNKTFKRSERLKANDKVRRKVKKKEIAVMLGGKCSDCGLELTDENLCVFDLHHKNLADKEDGDRDWRKPQMMTKILEGKIMLLCSNCHRMVHHKNGDILYLTPKKLLPKIVKDENEAPYQNFVKTSDTVQNSLRSLS